MGNPRPPPGHDADEDDKGLGGTRQVVVDFAARNAVFVSRCVFGLFVFGSVLLVLRNAGGRGFLVGQ